MQEYFLVGAVGLFIAAQVLHSVAGPVKINITNPLQFLSPAITSRYPLTTVEVFIRALALAITIILLLSFINKKYFFKMATCIVLGGIGILYAIQQLANQGRLTPLQWTLAFALGGMMLLPAIAYFLIRGIIEGIYYGVTKKNNNHSQSENISSSNSSPDKKFWGEE